MKFGIVLCLGAHSGITLRYFTFRTTTKDVDPRGAREALC